MPCHIRVAKRANYAIVKATNGLSGLPARDLADDDKDEGEGGEDGAEGDSLDDDSDEEECDAGVDVIDSSSNIFDTLDGIEDDVDSRGGGVATDGGYHMMLVGESRVRFVLMHKTSFGDEKYVRHKHKSHFVFVLHKHNFSFGNAPLLALNRLFGVDYVHPTNRYVFPVFNSKYSHVKYSLCFALDL